MDEDLTKDLLREKFSKFGKTCSVVIMKTNDGKLRSFGFVNFESSEDVQKAVQAMQGALLPKVIRHAYGMSKRIGFVCFSSPKEAKKALEALHGISWIPATGAGTAFGATVGLKAQVDGSALDKVFETGSAAASLLFLGFLCMGVLSSLSVPMKL
ncbi:RNA recognition motif domain [Dillenia turbinata]|uniref:RNA recognition motif domain n=1 Tax=Dillenia turbinata TaxID=194707 RepID=A0AAN8Z8X2_9MAGN